MSFRLTDLRMKDVPSVGGRTRLGEMISQLQEKGVRVPARFATTSQAYRDFLSYSTNGSETLARRIEDRLAGVDINDVRALADAGADIRKWIEELASATSGKGNSRPVPSDG